MEVEDELMDELSMSLLEPAAVLPAVAEGDEGAGVTITVNTRGEVNVDQESLNTFLGSGQQSTRVTFVRVDDGGQSTIESQIELDSQELLAAYGQTDGGAEAEAGVNVGDMVLNPDQLKSLEKVLESDEAKTLLNVEEECSENVENKTESLPETQIPTRRSQRQVDRETKQLAEKIKNENREQETKEGGGEAGGRGRGKGGMMRGGSRSARSRKHPRSSPEEETGNKKPAEETEAEGENEEDVDEEEEEEEEEEEDSDSGSWRSEDDPDRLWCICQKPHSNKFMICCDTCLDWFHGSCVGITKAQGKEMEMAGKDWKCPECLQGVKRGSTQSGGLKTAQGKASAPTGRPAPADDIDELLNDSLEDEFLGSSKVVQIEKPRRKSSSMTDESDKKREKDRSLKHSSSVEMQEHKTKLGHKAPSEAPNKVGTSGNKLSPNKSQLSSKEKSGPKIIPAHRGSDKKAQKIEDLIKKRPVKSREEMVAETKAALRRSVSSQDSIRANKRERRSSESTDRRPTPVKRKPIEKTVTDYEYKEAKTSDNSSFRSTVTRGLRDALLEKLKSSDLKIEDRKVSKIAEEIEIAMFGTFGEAGPKYKNKYRSLTFNIKDPKNDGLFRRILLKDLQPLEVVQMSAADYASKELQQWRKVAAQKDIEAIKSHELEMIALGNTFVMKSHKGEQVIEKSDELVSSSSGPATGLALLPEEQDQGQNKETSDQKKKEKKERRHKEKHRERHSSGKSHSHSSKDKKHSKERDKERSSHKSSSSDKDRKHSSKSHSSSSSSKSKKDKSRDKERSSSSKSSGEKSKETESSKPASSVVPEREEPDMTDLQAQINKATAAIEAAKKSQPVIVTDNLSQSEQPEPEIRSESTSRPGSPLDLDLPYSGSWVEEEVSSTVTIPTPDQPESWSGNTAGEPSVWEGQVNMPDVAKFSVSAFQVSGTSDYLSVDLKSSLELVGRIPPSVCWDYIDKIGKNPTKEILVLKLGPSNNDEKQSYQTFFQYYHSRERFGVVGNCNKSVKDCYIMPLKATEPVPAGLLPMSGQGLPLTRPDLLLTIIVRTKRTRPGEQLQQRPPERSITSGLPPVSRPFPAAPPAVPLVNLEDGSSPYSPAGSSPEVIADSGGPGGSADGFSEQLARLQREVAAKRAELAQREQQLARPEVGLTPDPGPGPGPGGSTLSRMSADDLLAAAAAMEQPSPSKQSLPPPGPGMPGNLLGQGRGNLDLARDDGHGGDWDRQQGYRGGHRGGGRGGHPWNDRRGRGGGGGGWGDRRGRGGWDRGRDYGDWGRRDERDSRMRDRRDDRDRGGWRERDRDRYGGDYRRERRDFDRREPRDYRERERDRSRHENRRYEEGERSWRGRDNLSNLGTEDWSDEEMRIESDSRQNQPSSHMSVAEEIAGFDKQFPPKSGE